MLRTLSVLALAGAGLAIVGSGGRIGPIDLTDIPLAMFGFVAVSVLVVAALSRI